MNSPYPFKHTPGPWQSHDDDYCPEEIWGNLEGPLDGEIRGTLVCTVDDGPEMLGNIALLKAAPDLLAVCKLYLAHATGSADHLLTAEERRRMEEVHNGYTKPIIIERMQAAIAKAELHRAT